MLGFLPFSTPGSTELLIVAIIALLLFGKRLPEVARSLGKGITEFKKGVAGIEQDVDKATYSQTASSRPVPKSERDEFTAPKFEPPRSEPTDASPAESPAEAESTQATV
jgi:sec-independent protein translocase protein TatA